MKKIAFAFALGLALSPMAASAASYQELAEHVNPSAFEDADDGWRRMVVLRKSECGYYGSQREIRRVDVLIDRYNALGAAVSAGDEGAAMAAAQALNQKINANGRYETCWRYIARRSDVPKGLTGVLRDF